MDTFTPARDFINDSLFSKRRNRSLKYLDINAIDQPIKDIISMLRHVPYCFTLQCCWGHFVHDGQTDPRGLETLASYSENTTITYRIAYLAICIKHNDAGIGLYKNLQDIVKIDPHNIQFGSADWFWREHTNSYILQVEPERFCMKDTAVLGVPEAIYIQGIRNKMFEAIREICVGIKTNI